MKLELLGETSIPETISYLDNGYVYIGKIPIDPFVNMYLQNRKCGYFRVKPYHRDLLA